MKAGIMQPYFFPYTGYFSLIKHTDKWVIFDTAQYIRHGWVNRNRILKPLEGWQYITIPLKKHERETAIKDIVINTNEDWKNKILRQLEHYKKFAPYYSQTIAVIEKCFDIDTVSLLLLNVHILKELCNYLEIPFNYSIFSEMDLSIATVTAPDEWSLNISKAMGATQYINPPGGREFFDKKKFEQQNIDLKFLNIEEPRYIQGKREFITGLSIIDILMFNDIQKTNAFIDNYKLD